MTTEEFHVRLIQRMRHDQVCDQRVGRRYVWVGLVAVLIAMAIVAAGCRTPAKSTDRPPEFRTARASIEVTR